MIFAALLLGLIVGCKGQGARQGADRPQEAKVIDLSKFEKIYVDEVEQIAEVRDSAAVEIKISGNLPNPAYTLVDFYVEVKGNTIEITPLATVDRSKMVIQVIVPFERVVTVKNLKPGTYKVKVQGRGGVVSADARLMP
jgi:hypothetical protein